MWISPARAIFDAAKIIASEKGQQIPIEKLDPFVSGAKIYQDAEINVLWAKQLAYTDESKLIDGHRIYISRVVTNTSWESGSLALEDDDDDDDGIGLVSYDGTSVFDYLEAFNGDGDTFVYVPGNWIEHLLKIRQTIPTPWLQPKGM